jgi:hypothetical protein
MLLWANAIGVAHIIVEMWLAAGIPLSLLFPRLLRWYVTTLFLAIGSRLAYGACPLTTWQEAIKHRPDVEPLLATHTSIEAPGTWMGLELGTTDTHWLMAGALVASSALLAFRHRRNAERLIRG